MSFSQENSRCAIALKRLPHARDLPLPCRMSAHASGFDLMAAVDAPLVLEPGQRVLVPTGWCMAIPPGLEVQIRPRSGLALKHGITVLNAPGTVDADYRGEVKVILINCGHTPFSVSRGDRIAQAVVARVAADVSLQEAQQLDETVRGSGGFGHSG